MIKSMLPEKETLLFKDKIHELNSIISSQQSDIQNLKSSVNELNASIHAILANTDELLEEMILLRQKNESLEYVLDSQREEHDVLENRVHVLERKLACTIEFAKRERSKRRIIRIELNELKKAKDE